MDDGYFHRGVALLTAATLDDGKQVLPIIEMYASSGDEEDAIYAIRTMSLLHSEDSVSIINDMLGNLRSPDNIRTAFAVLARINTPEAAAILEKNLYSREQVLQEQSVWALSIAKSGNNVEYLAKAIASDSLTPQSLAVLAESQAGPAVFGSILQRDDMPADKIIKLLEIMEEHTMLAPGSVRSETAEIIGSLFDSPNTDLQIAAIRTLGKIGAAEDKSSLLIPKLPIG
jgi:HEAT repeat protein